MQFSKLGGYFEELEQTASRLKMTEILARIFKEASLEEIDKICYLSLGRLVPLYENLEFNLADKMVMRSIARVTDKEVGEVLKLYKKLGDLGLVASELLQNKAKPLSVLEVYKTLRRIAEDGGVGSQERKVAGLANLLKNLDATGAKYVARMVLGKLRLGFSDKTIIDGLSWMKVGDKSLRDQLEQAYFVRADIGALAREAKSTPLRQGFVGQVKPQLGVPIMPALCQRLKTADEMIAKMGKVAVEPKLDGTRCISGHTGLLVKGRGYTTAKEVRVSNEVLTHRGRFRRVVGVVHHQRGHGERIFRFQTYLGDEFRVSEGHRFLVQDGEELQWLPIESIGNRWVFFPKPVLTGEAVSLRHDFIDKAGYKKTVDFNEDLFRFLGYWVGDGISNTSHQMERVGLVFNKDNKLMIDVYERIVRNILHITEIGRDSRRGAVVLYWRDPVFRKWLCEHFRGEHESGKRIPEWFFGLDAKRFLAFLRGWQDADGTTRSVGGNRIVTKERQLAMMAQILGFKHSVPLGIRRVRMKPSHLVVKKTYYELITAGTDRYVRPFKYGYLVKVKRIEPYVANLKLRLYDLQVEGDESFCVSVASLHNCQIHMKGTDLLKTFTRNLEDSTRMFPELEEAYKEVKADSVILDSEAVGMDPKSGKLLSFQQTIVRKRKHGIEETSRQVPLKFFVFDVLYLNGESLIDKPLSKRRQVLEEILKPEKVLVLTEQIVTEDAGMLREYHHRKLVEGLEGAVIKKIDGEYVPGRRGWNWVKFKEEETAAGGLSDTLDCVVMGYYRGKGKRVGFGIGAFLVGVRKGDQFLTIAKIGTGLSDAQWRELKIKSEKFKISNQPKEYQVHKSLVPDVWIQPAIVVEIAADNITKSPNHSAGWALRFPRLVRFREDKGPEQATSLQEVKQLLH